jgi:hypothetical protein
VHVARGVLGRGGARVAGGRHRPRLRVRFWHPCPLPRFLLLFCRPTTPRSAPRRQPPRGAATARAAAAAGGLHACAQNKHTQSRQRASGRRQPRRADAAGSDDGWMDGWSVDGNCRPTRAPPRSRLRSCAIGRTAAAPARGCIPQRMRLR